MVTVTGALKEVGGVPAARATVDGFTVALARQADEEPDAALPDPRTVIVAESVCVVVFATGFVASRVHVTVTRTRSTSGTTEELQNSVVSGVVDPDRHVTWTVGVPTTKPPSLLVTAVRMALYEALGAVGQAV